MSIATGHHARNNEDWQRVSRRRPCLICEKPDWCLYAGADDAPSAAICARIESPKRCGEAGWLHRLRDDDWHRPLKRTRRRVVKDATRPVARPMRDWRRFMNECEQAIASSWLDELAIELGVSIDSLLRLCIGWSGEHRAFTFPMFDMAGVVRGVRLRGSNGRKWSVRGGQEGLFVPRSVGGTEGPLPDATARLVVCEGPTDTAALLDLDFDVLGRPSCAGGMKLLVDLVQSCQPNDVAIFADADTPGLRGANNLASTLAVYVPSVRVVTPPPSAKDARDWKRQGATHADVLARIAGAQSRRLGVVGKAVAR